MNKLALIFILLFVQIQQIKSNNQIDYLVDFAKVYGYVKYFHPSDEAYKLDWDYFAIYGTSQILEVKNDKDFEKVMTQLFGPTIVNFSLDNKIHKSNIVPENESLYWQHKGINFGKFDKKRRAYKSLRVFPDKETLFETNPSKRKVICYKTCINKNIQIPITISIKSKDSQNLNEIKSLLGNIQYLKNKSELDLKSLYLGNIINSWNVIQHFYPYFKEVNVYWEEELKEALKDSTQIETVCDVKLGLEKMLSKLKDGHIRVGLKNNQCNTYYLPLRWEFIESRLVVTNVLKDEDRIQIGSIINSINGINVISLVDSTKRYISASTPDREKYTNAIFHLKGKKNEKTIINFTTLDGTNEVDTFYKNIYYTKVKEIDFRIKKNDYFSLGDSLIYINLSSPNNLDSLLWQKDNWDKIIFDLRGYPKKVNKDFLTYFMSSEDTSSCWFKKLLIEEPDQKKVDYFCSSWGLVKSTKNIANCKVVFLTNYKAISYSESLLQFVKHYSLGTIIGSNTAGTNGNINPFYLPGGFRISWTGMKVNNIDGSQFHGIGVIPDVFLKKSINGVRDNVDELLEYAIFY